jgi:tetratricopeptide (TPR) repeat protein
MRDSRRKEQIILGFVLAAATFAVFGQTLGYGFVFDDQAYVVENRHVHALTAENLRWAFTGVHGANWHPVTWVSHMIDCELYGLKPAGHHLSNLLWHAANVLLLFGLLLRMTGSVWKSGFVAGLFAVHPLHVESVAWVAERKDVLSTFFWIATTWAYVRYAERPGVGRYVPVVVLFALGLMSKPMLVTLPFVLLLLDYWPLRRYRAFKVQSSKFKAGAQITDTQHLTPDTGSKSTSTRMIVLEKAPLFALAAASSIVTYWAQQKQGTVMTADWIPLGLRAENALVSYVKYALKMFWPSGLAAYYPHPKGSLPIWQVVGSAVLLVLITVFVIRAGKPRPYLVVGWLWYVGALVPVIGLVQVGGQAMADRYTYVPLIGLFIMAAWGIPDFLKGQKRRSDTPTPHTPTLAALAILVVSALAAGAFLQARHWESNLTLFARAVEVTSGNALAHNNLGLALAERGSTREAIRHYREAIRINPQYADAHYNLANTFARQGRNDEAAAEYSEALRIDPGHRNASLGMANLLAGQGKGERAAAYYAEALERNPEDAEAHYNLGVILARQGKTDEAVSHYEDAIRIDPDYAEAHNNLGMLFLERGEIDEAISHLTEALRIKPNYAKAHYNLGMALANRGELDEAITHFSEAAKISPDYAEAHNNLGSALAARGRIQEAADHFSRALEIKPRFAEAHLNLGMALSSLGNLDEAVSHYSEAARIKPDYADAHKNLAVALYLQGKYAEAWKEVDLCRKYGGTLHPDFVRALSQKMAEP